MQVSSNPTRSSQSVLNSQAAAAGHESAHSEGPRLSSGARSLLQSAASRSSSTSPDTATPVSNLSVPACEADARGTADDFADSPLQQMAAVLHSLGGAFVEFFSFAASALGDVAQAAFVVYAAAEVIGGAGAKLANGLGSLWNGARHAAAGIYLNLDEAIRTLARGASKMLQGYVAGLKDVGLGLAKLAQTPIDAALLLGGKALSAIQTLSGVEPIGRELKRIPCVKRRSSPRS